MLSVQTLACESKFLATPSCTRSSLLSHTTSNKLKLLFLRFASPLPAVPHSKTLASRESIAESPDTDTDETAAPRPASATHGSLPFLSCISKINRALEAMPVLPPNAAFDLCAGLRLMKLRISSCSPLVVGIPSCSSSPSRSMATDWQSSQHRNVK